jgi:hypothetical protein
MKFNPRILRSQTIQIHFEDALVNKVKALLGWNVDRLDRRCIDALYPYLRCRSWFGRENSINNRFGYSVLPYFDLQIVQSALTVPVRYKHFGSFEREMLRAVDEHLAGYYSAYGFPLNQRQSLRAVLPELIQLALPSNMRRHTHMVKSVGRPQVWQQRSILSKLIDDSFPRMSTLLIPRRVTNCRQFNRLCTLEYMFEDLNCGILLDPEGLLSEQTGGR